MFADSESADRAIRELNGTELDGRKIFLRKVWCLELWTRSLSFLSVFLCSFSLTCCADENPSPLSLSYLLCVFELT